MVVLHRWLLPVAWWCKQQQHAAPPQLEQPKHASKAALLCWVPVLCLVFRLSLASHSKNHRQKTGRLHSRCRPRLWSSWQGHGSTDTGVAWSTHTSSRSRITPGVSEPWQQDAGPARCATWCAMQVREVCWLVARRSAFLIAACLCAILAHLQRGTLQRTTPRVSRPACLCWHPQCAGRSSKVFCRNRPLGTFRGAGLRPYANSSSSPARARSSAMSFCMRTASCAPLVATT